MPLEGVEEEEGSDMLTEALPSRSPARGSRVWCETSVDPLVVRLLQSCQIGSRRSPVAVRGECSDVRTAWKHMTALTRFRSIVLWIRAV